MDFERFEAPVFIDHYLIAMGKIEINFVVVVGWGANKKPTSNNPLFSK
jgi:hypothetical protein